LRDTYGYTDDAIVDCLEYIYNVQKKKILSESLVLVGPKSMAQMKAWRADQKARASGIAAAVAHTEMKEYIVPIKENKKKREEINLDDALLD
jgi:DNA-binding MltR family transcriptional regulator